MTGFIKNNGEYMNILRAKKDEYDEIQRFIEEVFGRGYNYWAQTYPSVWKKDNTRYENTFIIKEDGKIVSLIRLAPVNMVINNTKIKLGGIGAVSTSYEHRGKGYMSSLMKAMIEEMKKEKYPISILWGDRHRYSNFGYENSGDIVEVCITARGIEKLKVELINAKRFLGQKEILKKIIDIYNKHPIRIERTYEEFKEIFKKQGSLTYYAVEKEKFGYVSIQGEFIEEYGGSPDIILKIMKYLNKRFGTQQFLMHFPTFSLIPQKILKVASWWHKISVGMIKIISLKDTLQIYQKNFKENLSDREEITFTIKNGESIIIKKSNGHIQLEEGIGKNQICLSESEMVRLLFSSPDWFPDIPCLKTLKSICPFETFFWRLNMV
ncbi:MAG: GNAT family N-acetyltransferase [Candidatus Omnitrophica bacterium]|nr:GNAT family N-acetyltransferase [Candidatus Omnitrophota bacterium]